MSLIGVVSIVVLQGSTGYIAVAPRGFIFLCLRVSPTLTITKSTAAQISRAPAMVSTSCSSIGIVNSSLKVMVLLHPRYIGLSYFRIRDIKEETVPSLVSLSNDSLDSNYVVIARCYVASTQSLTNVVFTSMVSAGPIKIRFIVAHRFLIDNQ